MTDTIRKALQNARDWFDQQGDAISKASGSTWDLLQVREQRDLCDAALSAQPRPGGGEAPDWAGRLGTLANAVLAGSATGSEQVFLRQVNNLIAAIRSMPKLSAHPQPPSAPVGVGGVAVFNCPNCPVSAQGPWRGPDCPECGEVCEFDATAKPAAPQPPAEAQAQVPSYDALLIIAQSVCGALERAGITDCDDPGEAIDVLRERYEAQAQAGSGSLMLATPEQVGMFQGPDDCPHLQINGVSVAVFPAGTWAEVCAAFDSITGSTAPPSAPAPVADNWIDSVIRDVCELDPADGPSSVSVMLKDLHLIIERHAPAAPSAPVGVDAVGLIAAWRRRAAIDRGKSKKVVGFMRDRDEASSSAFAVCASQLEQALAQQPAAVDGVRERLVECRDWFDQQAETISKGGGSTWDLLQCREQRDLCDAALAQPQGASHD